MAHERLLHCLSEDASRVIQISLLSVQRGLDNVARGGESKRDQLVRELNGVYAVVDLLECHNVFAFDLLGQDKLAERAASFNGIRQEKSLLTTLGKRFADVVEWSSKSVRFGLNDSSPGVRMTNSQQTQFRLVEAFVAVEVLKSIGGLPENYLSPELQKDRRQKIEGWLAQEVGV